MKNKEIYSFINEINNKSFDNIESTEFNLALLKNIKKMEEEITLLDKLRAQSEDYKKYSAKANSLRTTYADKDEHGSPVIKTENGRQMYSVSEANEKELVAEFEKLNEEFKETLDEQQKKNTAWLEALEKEVDINFKKIAKSELPKGMTLRQLYFLDFMIDE